MGVKLAKAMGAHVTHVHDVARKRARTPCGLGADEVLVSTRQGGDEEARRGKFHFLLDTIPVSHDINPYLGLLKLDGAMALVGALTPIDPVVGGQLDFRAAKPSPVR